MRDVGMIPKAGAINLMFELLGQLGSKLESLSIDKDLDGLVTSAEQYIDDHLLKAGSLSPIIIPPPWTFHFFIHRNHSFTLQL